MDLQIKGDEENGYDLIGNLTLETVPDLFKQSPFESSNSTSLNLAGVERIDSAGLALLVEWSCQARARDKALVLKNLPVSLKSLIDVSGLQAILSLSD